MPSHRKEKGSRTRRHRIPDITSTDQNGAKSAVDYMVTTVACKKVKAIAIAIEIEMTIGIEEATTAR